MTARPCVGCPFRHDCPSCPWTGEIPAAATVSDAVSGGADDSMGPLAQTRETPAKARTDRGRGPTVEESNVNDRTPKRIQRKRSKGWKMPEGAVYVGRPTRWGNPVAIAAPLLDVGYEGCTAEQAVEHYRNLVSRRASFHATGNGGGFMHVTANPVNDRGDVVPTEAEIRTNLRGLDLACWCPLDQPCHADVLLEIANGGNA